MCYRLCVHAWCWTPPPALCPCDPPMCLNTYIPPHTGTLMGMCGQRQGRAGRWGRSQVHQRQVYKRFCFLEQNFSFTANSDEIEFSILPCPMPPVQHPHKGGMVVTTDEPRLTRHYHPESVIYTSVYSWCCAFCGFGQVCNDMQGIFIALTLLCACLVIPSSPSVPGNH